MVGHSASRLSRQLLLTVIICFQPHDYGKPCVLLYGGAGIRWADPIWSWHRALALYLTCHMCPSCIQTHLKSGFSLSCVLQSRCLRATPEALEWEQTVAKRFAELTDLCKVRL